MVENQSGLPVKRNQWVGLISTLLKKPLVQTLLGIVGLVLLGGAVVGIHQTQVPPPQPIQFSHKQHITLGIPCLYCHPGVLRGDSAGLPSVSTCNGCHQQIANPSTDSQTSQELAKFASYVKNNQPILWVPVAILPDFVYFNHNLHISSGLSCEHCHAELSQMTVAVPQKMNMGWCLDCHRTRYKTDPAMVAKLTDCITCHK
jgi:Cytochrome c7 and related cytochrome c